ncbi:hypothetical protein FNH22_29285 [Fulvivirga sp. M361]|uniref:outer membrane beta-barrel protein n=1 Tax=Fulvivirga sp. M361 TaxID=2594266 RepID=UPI00117B4D49|nr:outer membrane beta-barrel protein [Fulvivirga sp. M361]TRX48411.1 hypothetical protein FNH22_29285 [Fulvivirga sp. M361]
MKQVIPIFFVLNLFATEITGQSFYNFKKGRDIIASFGTGTTSYFGDLNEPGDIIDTKLNFNAGLQYYFTNRVAVRAEGAWFRLSGDDTEAKNEGRLARNLSFKSDNVEINVVGIVQAFPNGTRFYQRPNVNFYGYGGIGILFFNPKGEVPQTDWNGNALADAGKFVSLQPLQTEGEAYSRWTFVIPLGAGIKVKAGPFFNVGIEGGYRFTFTDYLDDVSTRYIDHNSLDADPLRQALADKRYLVGLTPSEAGKVRGDDSNNDGYFIFNIKLEYYLPANIFSTSKSTYNKRRRKYNLRRPRRR